MAVSVSGNITQSPGGSIMSFNDTTTGLVAPITRSLIVYDPTGTVIGSPAFSGAVAQQDITQDGWFQFVETITDANGSYTQTINYLSTAFYDNQFVNVLAQLGCGCSLVAFNFIDISYFFRQAALRLALGGFGVAAQANILAAYAYLTQS